MSADVLVAFEPRKTPIQARSAVTVEAISEATIQVLLSHGAERLTTRIAERAGVSVGTLYQYYTNKQSLLFALLEHHLNNVAGRVEAACESANKPLAEMIRIHEGSSQRFGSREQSRESIPGAHELCTYAETVIVRSLQFCEH